MSVVAVLLAALATGAPPTRVTTVVRVVGSKAAASDRSVADAARAGLRWLLDVEVLSYDERARLEDEVRRCGEDNGCVLARLSTSGVDLGVYVVANFEVSPPLITLELLDTKRRRSIARKLVDAQALDIDVAITGAVERVLLETGLRVGGEVVADIVPGEAKVTLDDRPIEVGVPVLSDVGAHVLRVRLDGYVPLEQRLDVALRDEQRLALRLEPEPGILSTWWFWTAVGVAVAGGVTAAVIAARPDTLDTCHPVGGGVCPP